MKFLTLSAYYLTTGDIDFDSRDQRVSFSPSDSRRCAQIAIIDDTLFEGDEQFLVKLQSFSSSQVIVGEISEARVTIIDDDAGTIICLFAYVHSESVHSSVYPPTCTHRI